MNDEEIQNLVNELSADGTGTVDSGKGMVRSRRLLYFDYRSLMKGLVQGVLQCRGEATEWLKHTRYSFI